MSGTAIFCRFWLFWNNLGYGFGNLGCAGCGFRATPILPTALKTCNYFHYAKFARTPLPSLSLIPCLGAHLRVSHFPGTCNFLRSSKFACIFPPFSPDLTCKNSTAPIIACIFSQYPRLIPWKRQKNAGKILYTTKFACCDIYLYQRNITPHHIMYTILHTTH